MEHSFWKSRWSQGRIGFHLPEVNANLVKWHERWLGRRSPDSAHAPRVLVPLCGKSQDLVWLARQGHEVVGIEFVEQAVHDFFDEQGLSMSRQEQGAVTCYETTAEEPLRVRLLVADWFKLKPTDIPACDLVYDRAACVAIPPERRAEYVARLSALSPPGAALLLIGFEHDIGSGPPFSVPADEIRRLTPNFELELVDDQDILAESPQFADRGASYLREQVYLGRRKATAG